MNNIDKIENWTEVTHGLYRYVIATKACYEIHVLYHANKTPIETAKASLFVVGFWHNEQGESFFERECLLAKQPVFECLKVAAKDYKENSET